MVSSLSDGWDVDIAAHDLSEVEAFELEAELVAKFGGPSALGGGLANWMPGGETPVAISIEALLSDESEDAELELKEFTRQQQESIVTGLQVVLERLLECLQTLEEKGKEADDSELVDGVLDVETIIGTLFDDCADFLRRRCSWKEFAVALNEAADDLSSENSSEYHRKVRRPLTRASRATRRTLARILLKPH